jgi:hypothetical protein
MVLSVWLGGGFGSAAYGGHRSIPRPLVSHPGNVFVAGEPVVIVEPPGEGEAWRVTDYEGNGVGEGSLREGRAEVGLLRCGYYELARGTGRVSLGVVEGLRAPTPLTSPIGLDVAMSWFYTKGKMSSVASLCALAGVNRVRDRLDWQELEPQRGQFAPSTRYDDAARAQSAAGLQILQVSHRSPSWANSNTQRFPLDLRDTYEFHRALARRWRGTVAAFEPWNEADIKEFGGQTGSEIATLQKAAYLGLKAGNRKVIACQNVFAIHRAATLGDFADNEAWASFDTFNLHHYDAFEAYPKLYADFRAVSAGKPLWVTECSRPVKWHGSEQAQEPTADDLRVQSERVAITYALAVHEGAEAVFYFMLPHYVEGQVQFGVVRRDLTPRPAFLALAAAGRLLSDAKPLGRVECGDPDVRGFLFAAEPDGRRAEVLVIWSEQERSFRLPVPAQSAYDHLGRRVELSGLEVKVARAPRFIVLAHGAHFPLIPPPPPAQRLSGSPSAVVLQAVLPENSIMLEASAYKVPAGTVTSIPLFVYNFGTKRVQGRLRVTASEGWQVDVPGEVAINPGERGQIEARVTPAPGQGPIEGKIRFTGEFGSSQRPVLALRLRSG